MAHAPREPIVLDNGSGFLKGGLASADEPSKVIPVITGKRSGWSSLFVGEDARKPMVHAFHPVEKGLVQDWGHMEVIWEHMLYTQLKVKEGEHPVLLTEIPSSPDSQREAMTQIFFEQFCVPALHIGMQPALSVISMDQSCGLVVDSGETMTQICPVHNYQSLTPNARRFEVGGRHITEWLMRNMTGQGLYLEPSSSRDMDHTRKMKEALCYVAEDFDKEISIARTSSAVDATFTFCDGRKIGICQERFNATEVLFNPKPLGVFTDGLPEQIDNCIKSTSPKIQEELYDSVLLTGGNSKLGGKYCTITDSSKVTI